jgi:hypothetical protein
MNDNNDIPGTTNVTPGGFGTSSGAATGTTGSGSSSFGSGAMGGTSASTGASGFNVDSSSELGSESAVCGSCGQSLRGSGGLDQFLGRLGINEDMINNLKSQFQNVDIDEYLNTARDYLKGGTTKATAYSKENPGKVAAGVAALALGAGLLYAAVNRDRA